MRFETLKQAKDFKQVYKKGIHINNDYFRIFMLIADDGRDIVRLGYAVSKKIGNAVTRNRIKRLLKEALKNLEKDNKKSIDFFVVFKSPVVNLSFHDLSNLIHNATGGYLS